MASMLTFTVGSLQFSGIEDVAQSGVSGRWRMSEIGTFT